ncbi:GntR family transcriptional regulator [Roseomonas sp. M0104]|uniref:GntR family transcriptional regulator n=2 Tax=Teichococcus coralli TaxID=2545983 RepID=A0A845BGP7_9PROT|nr:GntR family transcriptional regulator [Pseudoroseomonas coralli]MXP65224.1 GntR family transcriptional regulator [Pseudoroseomonas coralli]
MTDAEDSSGEGVYRRLRADVVLARLAPGQKLGLDALRQVYGTSIGTLREALNRLASEGLIAAEGQRGFTVAPVSEKDFREIADLRLLLECHALVPAFAAGDLEWEGRVVGAHHKLAVLERRLLAGEPADAALWKRYDREFHHALIETCGSAALLETCTAAYDRYLRYQMVAVLFRGTVAAEQHAALLDCALRRDAASACRVLEAHVAGCVDHVVRTGALLPFAGGRPAARPLEAAPPARLRARA